MRRGLLSSKVHVD
uniref:Uncharacterized protein n=1 Tax=Arundo donax TaxID=35708 RepID=A0A0A8ZW76_ARUDO